MQGAGRQCGEMRGVQGIGRLCGEVGGRQGIGRQCGEVGGSRRQVGRVQQGLSCVENVGSRDAAYLSVASAKSCWQEDVQTSLNYKAWVEGMPVLTLCYTAMLCCCKLLDTLPDACQNNLYRQARYTTAQAASVRPTMGHTHWKP